MADPPQPNTYHHLRIQVQSIAKGPSILKREAINQGLFDPPDEYDFKNLWLGVNGQYKELLGPTIGEFSRTLPKNYNPTLTYDVIVAEQGVGSQLNMKGTGYIRSTADDCFQPDSKSGRRYISV